jgi:hypothetical protein
LFFPVSKNRLPIIRNGLQSVQRPPFARKKRSNGFLMDAR